MTLKQTAALGLSALIISSNLVLPYASAATVVMSSQPDAKAQLNQMIDNRMLLALAQQQQLLHPIHKKRNLFSRLNPLSYVFRRKQHNKAVQIAATLPLNTPIQAKATPVHSKAKAVNTKDITPIINAIKADSVSYRAAQIAQANHKSSDNAVAMPIDPTATANPAILATPIDQQASGTTSSALTATEAANAPQPAADAPKVTYTQIHLPPNAAVTATQTSHAEIIKEHIQKFTNIYQTRDPNEKLIASKPATAEETFQMLAASPLDKLALQAPTSSSSLNFTSGLDHSLPNASMSGEGNVKVLRSGITQKVTNVELAIGKAEVLYLSRPASRVSVSNPDVATAVVISPTQIQLVGKAIGVANLLVWGDMVSPEHTVVDISVHRDVSVLVNQLKYVDPGIQIVPMAAEDTVILTGQAETRESAQLAIEMAKAFFGKSSGSMAGAAGFSSSGGPNSQAPGSATPGLTTNIINLVKVKGEPSTKLELVRQRIRELDPNVRIEVVPGPDGNEKVILTGRVASASIASKALNLASVFYGQPGLKVVTAQGGNEVARMQASADSGSSSSGGSGGSSAPSGGGSASGGTNLLQGSVVTDATGNVISMLEIAQKPQIRCSIKFLELSKTSLNALGGTLSGVRGQSKFAHWSGVHSPAPGKGIAVLDSQTPPGAAWSTTSSRSTTGNGWTPTSQSFFQSFREVYQNGITQAFTINNTIAGAIQALQDRRQVRTLAEPTLTILSGEQGSFLAGGEIPIAFVGGQGQVSIEYHEFGIRLNLLPNVTDDGKIQIQVSPEVSALDQANAVSTNSINVPAFTTRRMNTTLLVEPGQSFILAGLYNQQDTDSISRFPGLGSLPIIGSFFSNKWKNKNNSEMVVVIKPEIIYSATGSTGTQTSALPNAQPEPVQKEIAQKIQESK